MSVTVDGLLLEQVAHPDDKTYKQYRTYRCSVGDDSEPIVGMRDGAATIRSVRWLSLPDEPSWGDALRGDRFLYPQLLAISAALRAPSQTLLAPPRHAIEAIARRQQQARIAEWAQWPAFAATPILVSVSAWFLVPAALVLFSLAWIGHDARRQRCPAWQTLLISGSRWRGRMAGTCPGCGLAID